ncbi:MULTISPECIES: ABC transporter permease [unclassified Geodermatophilus]|uniref:ABC transporter permease n=1 Tax=unclassified Geodermatophilus TaxID=2637632 RepID=UPI003EEDA7A9
MTVTGNVEPATTAVVAPVPPPEATGARRRRRRPRRLVVSLSLGWLVLLLAAIVLQPLLPLPDPTRSDYGAIAEPPGTSGAHLLGTDEIGRDILARLITGARVSLTVGIGSIAVAVLIGAALGICAGFFGGRVNRVVSGVVDVMLAFPALVALIALGVFLGPGLDTIIIGIGIVASPAVARVTRSATMAFTNREFVTAARGMGAGSWRILRREILPNVVVPVLAYATVLVAVAIVAEGSLSFLGLGVPPPESSWGSMMGTGRSELATDPHIVLLPAFAMFITLLALNFLAEHLGKRFDIRESVL